MSSQPIDGARWIPHWTFADRLRKARSSTDLTQRGFAERLDVSDGTYSQWEAGNSKPRDVVTVAKRLELLTGIPAGWLLGLNDEAPRPGGPVGASGECAIKDSNLEPTDSPHDNELAEIIRLPLPAAEPDNDEVAA